MIHQFFLTTEETKAFISIIADRYDLEWTGAKVPNLLERRDVTPGTIIAVECNIQDLAILMIRTGQAMPKILTTA